MALSAFDVDELLRYGKKKIKFFYTTRKNRLRIVMQKLGCLTSAPL
jgi:hypothetical protein